MYRVGGGFKVQSKSYNVLCAREEWSGTYISVPGRGRGGVLCSFCRLAGCPTRDLMGVNWAQLQGCWR